MEIRDRFPKARGGEIEQTQFLIFFLLFTRYTCRTHVFLVFVSSLVGNTLAWEERAVDRGLKMPFPMGILAGGVATE